jgi:hypothetical protein
MAYPANRVDLRNKIRSRLSAWVDDSGISLNAIASATAQGIVFNTGVSGSQGLDISEKALIQIDNEVIRVRVKDSLGAGSTALSISSCIRGDRGSTAATHLAGAAVNVYPFWGWTDFDINREIAAAIAWLWPDYWTLLTLTNTFEAGQTDFGLPVGCVYPQGNIVKRVELIDPRIPVGANGPVYKEILGWKHVGDRLILSLWTRTAYQARIWIQAAQPDLTTDTQQLASDDPMEAIAYYAASNLLEQMLANRTRYVEYSAALNDRASTPDELQRNAYYFKNQAVVARDRIMRPPLSGMASIRRTG